MKGPDEQRWRELCEQAAKETDPQRLMRLIEEITSILESKEKRLKEIDKKPTESEG